MQKSWLCLYSKTVTSVCPMECREISVFVCALGAAAGKHGRRRGQKKKITKSEMMVRHRNWQDQKARAWVRALRAHQENPNERENKAKLSS